MWIHLSLYWRILCWKETTLKPTHQLPGSSTEGCPPCCQGGLSPRLWKPRSTGTEFWHLLFPFQTRRYPGVWSLGWLWWSQGPVQVKLISIHFSWIITASTSTHELTPLSDILPKHSSATLLGSTDVKQPQIKRWDEAVNSKNPPAYSPEAEVSQLLLNEIIFPTHTMSVDPHQLSVSPSEPKSKLHLSI